MGQSVTAIHRKLFLSIVTALIAIVATGCQRRPRSIAPEGLAPISSDSVARWVGAFTPRSHLRYDLRWRFENDRGATGGRAAARIAPPDSVRFDIRGQLGRSGSAVVVGSAAVWSRPEGDFKDILQSAPLFWAALGAPIRPPREAPTFGARTAEWLAWRYVVGTDTFDFIDQRSHAEPRLLAEMRRRGQIIGIVTALFDSSGTRVASARVDFPTNETRFSFSVLAADTTEKLPADTWQRP